MQMDGRRSKIKTSRLAILSLVMGILSLFFFVLAGVPAIVVGIISQIKIKRNDGALKGKSIGLIGMSISIVFMGVFFWLWSRDAPPIPNDYTVADLRSAPAECAESFEILKILIDEDFSATDAPAIGLSHDDIDTIAEIRDVIEKGTPTEIAQILNRNSKDVETAWASSKKARDIIHRLNEFPEIADLSEPKVGSRTMRWHNLIELAHLYQVYSHLQKEQNDVRDFSIELIELDSVFRKLSVNVRVFIERLICHQCLIIDVKTVNTIINNPITSRDTVDLLTKYFKPVTKEELSLRNGVLFDYLFVKNIVHDVSRRSSTKKNPLFKINSTLRVYKNSHYNWLDAKEQKKHISATKLSAWPTYYPFKEPDLFRNRGSLSLIYRGYNPLGSRCLRMFGFYYKKYPRKCFILQIYDDLFQIVLNKRLGKEVSLKARAYSDEYIVDTENKKIFSPGPDGKAGTKDDIKLQINPKVLRWGDD
jgi:hypothetical protein